MFLLRVSRETIAIVITNSLELFIRFDVIIDIVVIIIDIVVIIVDVVIIDIVVIIIMHKIDDGDVISHGKHCHHLFHNDCLTLWLQKQPSCPCCRLAISEPPPGCAEEEMQEDDYVHDPYGTERLWLYIKWSMAVCGIA
jgi:Ring finger domain